jgi:VRR-NUC domain
LRNNFSGGGGMTRVAGVSRGNPELDFRRQVIDLANLYRWEHVGWRPAKTEDGWRTPGTGTMAKGWPDLTLVRTRDGRLIFAELKSDTGRLSDDQKQVLGILAAFGGDWTRHLVDAGVYNVVALRIETCVWRPRDLEEVKATLR